MLPFIKAYQAAHPKDKGTANDPALTGSPSGVLYTLPDYLDNDGPYAVFEWKSDDYSQDPLVGTITWDPDTSVWEATMGHCYAGQYAAIELAIEGIELAYFG